MDKFKQLETLWKQSETSVNIEKIDLVKLKNNRYKMKNTNIKGAATLFLTGFLVLLIMYLLDEPLKTTPIISSMIIIATVCFLQAVLMLYTADKISKIDETEIPATHLKQWQKFREYQLKLRRWNMPVYFTLLGISLGVYFYEILKNVDLWKVILAYVVTYFWMFFAYFYLGRKSIKREDARIEGIINELKKLEAQFQ